MPPKFQPRPPSPLHYEPLPLLSEEVLCPGSDDEGTLEQHRDKRQRVEALGTQYLQGRGLTILSAGLRGPFEYGWENPWARKGPRRRTNNIRRIPEEPGRAADTSEQRPNGTRLPVPVREVDRNAVLRARSAPLVASRVVRGRSAEWDSKRERREKGIGEHMDKSVTLNHGYGNVEEPTHRYTSFKSVNQDEPTQIDDVLPSSPKTWLKTVVKKRFQRTSESPSSTPTPMPGVPRSQDLVPREPSIPAQRRPTNTYSSRSPETWEQPVQNATISGFTPVNKRRPPQTLQSPIVGPNSVAAKAQNVHINAKDPVHASNGVVREIIIAEADELTKKGYEEVKHLSQEALKRAKADDNAHVEARRLSQEGALRAYRILSKGSPTEPDTKVTGAPQQGVRKALAGSPHEVPPSTSLPGFEYRLAKKTSSSSSRKSSSFSEKLEAAKADFEANRPSSSNRAISRFAEEMEAANTKAKARAIRRLSFTASGRPKSQESQSSRQGPSSPKWRHQGSPLRRKESSHAELLSEDDAYASATSKLPSINGDVYRSEALPEAQVVAAHPGGSKVPSGPSTNLLETDKQSLKFPSIDEGDSYMNLSTQAAIAKAQRSFQNDVLSPLEVSPQKHRSNLEVSPTAYRTANAALPLSWTSETTNGKGITVNDDEEPISTQAMIDAMSPFAVTTAKKKPTLVKHASFARSAVTSPASPTANHFRPYSPSMSTSVSPSPSPIRHSSPPPPPSVPKSLSKATSSLTSFSIAPNGTLTEVYQHDGQQQRLDDEDAWNLEDALEEAGSFLGTWEVEAEARKVGSVGKRGNSGTSGARGILSSGKARD